MKWIANNTSVHWTDDKGANKFAENGQEVPIAIVRANSWLIENGHVVELSSTSEKNTVEIVEPVSTQSTSNGE